jgi:hypothetical protein
VVRLEAWLTGRSWLALSALFLIITLAKGGFAFEVAAQDAQPTFPYPQPGLTALSFGLPALVWAFNIQGQTMLIGIMVLALIAVGYTLCAWLVQRSFTGQGRVLALICLGLGPTISVLLGNVGRHDFLVIFGGIILGLRGYRWWGAIVGAALMLLGNPEQAVVALAIASLVSFVSRFKNYRTKVLTVTGAAFLIYLALEMWASSLGIQGRSDWLGYHFKVSLLNFLGNGYLSLFAGYSLLWILVLWAVRKTGGRERVILIIAAIVVPFAVTLTTADQTRVFVGVSTAVLFMIISVDITPFTEALARITPNVVAWAFAVAVFLPVLDVTYRGFQRIPYLWLYDFVVSTGVVQKLGMGPW